MAEEQNGKTANDNPEPENGNPNQFPRLLSITNILRICRLKFHMLRKFSAT